MYCLLPITSTLWSLVPDITLKAGIAFTGFTIFIFYLGAGYEWPELSVLLRWGYTSIGIVSVLLHPNVGKGFAGITVRIQVFDWGIREGMKKLQKWADRASRKKAMARIP